MSTATQRIRELVQTTTATPKVALDTCCVQYYINKPPIRPWADCLDPVFRAGLDGKIELFVSTVVISELLSHVHFAHRNTGFDPELDLLSILNQHFQVLDVSGEVAKAAGRLRGNYVPGDRIVLGTPDALIGATSLTNGHTLFITNDAQLAQALPSENCIYLKHVALDWLAQHFPAECSDRAKPVTPSRRGRSLFHGASVGTPELGSIQPGGSVNWKRVLADAFGAAAALNEPCVFFVLAQRKKRQTETVELLFWQESLEPSRPAQRIMKRLKHHLGIKYNTERSCYEADPDKPVFVFIFTSLERERVRQSCIAAKNEQRKAEDAWESYLRPIWYFRSSLSLPQTTWLLCEGGAATYLKPADTVNFLDQAKNVLGWQDSR